MELIDHRRFADTGVPGDENELQPAAGCNAVERGKQRIDLGSPSVQFLRNQQAVRNVVLGDREVVDPAVSPPFSQTASKILLGAGRRLITILGGFGQQITFDHVKNNFAKIFTSANAPFAEKGLRHGAKLFQGVASDALQQLLACLVAF